MKVEIARMRTAPRASDSRCLRAVKFLMTVYAEVKKDPGILLHLPNFKVYSRKQCRRHICPRHHSVTCL